MRAAWVEFRKGRGPRWLGVVALLVIVALVFLREPISQRLLPDPRMNRQLERAQLALDQGRLSAADGSGARELFESVLAADPDQMTARQGLVEVRDAAIAQAQLALGKHRRFQARNNLALAEALSAPAVQLQPLRAQLRDLEETSSDTSSLLAQASARGVTDEAALALFDQVLQVDAENVLALAGRSELFARWLVEAEVLLASNRVREAQEIVDRVIADDPAHVDLPPVRAKLGEALAGMQRTQYGMLELARVDEQAGRFDQAADRYLQLANSGNDSAAVQEALHRLAAREALHAEHQAADFQFRRANASLEKARHWSPDAAEIVRAEKRVGQSRMAQERLLRTPSKVERQRLPLLLDEARQAITRGDFITPPGSSAWDKLRVASAIAPDSSQVLALQKEFSQRSRACFEQAMTGNQLKHAQTCLEASLSLEPYSAAANDARHRLADRWLAYAEERIAASDYPEAEMALTFARQWQPTHPKLKQTVARLQRARGSSP